MDRGPSAFTVVLTGGIASGKTAVSDRFAALGVPVIDMDRIAHDIVEPGKPALQQIREAFGSEFFDDEGRLDRRRMRTAIFADAEARARLERILHPLIGQEALRQVQTVDYPYCILVIPLFTDSARWSWIDRVLVVDVDEGKQIARVMARDKVQRPEAEAILQAQMGRKARLALADDIIDNSGTLEDLQVRVESLHAKYLDLASS